MFNAKFLALAALLLAGVQAQSTVSSASATSSAAVPTSTSQIPACVLACAQQAASSGGSCKNFTDPCVCTDAQFQKAATQCLTTKCTAADLQAAKQLQQALCGASGSGSGSQSYPETAASGSATHSGSGTGSGTVSSSATGTVSVSRSGSASGSGTASGASGSATRSGSAGTKVSFGQGGVIALGMTVAGAVVGGMML